MSTKPFPARRYVYVMAGPIACIIALSLPAPEGLDAEAHRVGAVALWMGIWWITEAIPIPATALLPLALFPFLGILDPGNTATAYGDRNIFLFAGGFFIAMAMQKWKLHERIALHIIARSGTEGRRLILGFMLATGFLSMWISNTATALMITPIGAAVLEQLRTRHPAAARAAAPALMLGIAYAASVGGIATLVGTPPNIVLVTQFSALFPDAPPVTFARWLAIGLPFTIVFLPVVWFVLTFILYRFPKASEGSEEAESIIRERLLALGPMNRGEKTVLLVSILTATCWITRPLWPQVLPAMSLIDDSTIAITFALLLFALPIDHRRGEFALDWAWASRIPWGILLLFGGGLALARGFSESGLVAWAGNHLGVLDTLPLPLIILSVALLVTFMTEMTSNLATASILLPILALTASEGLGIHPMILMVPATLSASCAFMLPVATPPNAIVFHGGHIDIPSMARAGIVLNLLGALLITALTMMLVPYVFGVLDVLPASAGEANLP